MINTIVFSLVFQVITKGPVIVSPTCNKAELVQANADIAQAQVLLITEEGKKLKVAQELLDSAIERANAAIKTCVVTKDQPTYKPNPFMGEEDYLDPDEAAWKAVYGDIKPEDWMK